MSNSDVKWTQEQQDAIIQKGENILVAAGAGSGKTAVLVERIIQKIINEKISIDELLVVTYTNAAASEMRERILEALYKRLNDYPADDNLQKQIILLGKAHICTIHSFCLDVIKNYFYEIDISSNFKIITNEENTLYQQEVIEDLFDELYEKNDEDLIKLVDNYTTYRSDDKLKEMVIEIYDFIQSMPFPIQWINEKINLFSIKKNIDMAETSWGSILLASVRDDVIFAISSLKAIEDKLTFIPEMQKFLLTIKNDISILKELHDATFNGWDCTVQKFQELGNKFQRWPVDKSCTLGLKDEIKEKRGNIKDNLKKSLAKILILNSNQAILDINQMHDILASLGKIIELFDERFKKLKKEKNILYFNDIEHNALKILTKVDENGNIIPTDVANFYKQKFVEIAIDEYQDSNQVQEFILSTISNNNNIFMVGDVKQSIYKFRQACPELFLGKYNSFSKTKDGNGLIIQLFKNFRSRNTIIDFTNKVFETIMSRELGELDYNEEEFLNTGAEYLEDENSYSNKDKAKTELLLLDLSENDETQEEEDIKEVIITKELEASIVASKIDEIISSKVQIYDKKQKRLRPVQYRDIVILLRSTKDNAIYYEKALVQSNIPVYSDSNAEYIETYEIQTILNVLRIIDNPKDDIALVSVLRSEIGNFSDNELTEIRLFDRESSFYQSLNVASQLLQNDLKEKVDNFLNMLKKWQNKSFFMNISELIWDIYTQTGFITYVSLMPNGSLRKANLKKFFETAHTFENSTFKGLFNFIRFFEKMKISSGDLSAAKTIGENENVVRIMSIHKSKGLEFPIVFLANSAKRPNLMDASKNILLHSDVGLGPDYIDSKRKIKFTTLPKLAINYLIKNETLSEEMRILYVALTRAREKLIIVGSTKDYEKEIAQKKEFGVSPIMLKKYNSFKDWIEFAYLNTDMEDLISVQIIPKNNLMGIEQDEKQVREFALADIDIDEISRKISFNYTNKIATQLPLKTSVSELKKLDQDIVTETNLDFKNTRPDFIKETKITAAQKGTLTHLLLQRIDFKNEAILSGNDEKINIYIENLIDDLLSKNIISNEEAKLINQNKILYFIKSDIGKKLQNAMIIEKEKAFCTKINVSLADDNTIVLDEKSSQYMLVQGIIDLFFKTSDNKWVLLDYKTDFVNDYEEELLVQKYTVQLKIYKKALEDFINDKISNVYIYSFSLGRAIDVNI